MRHVSRTIFISCMLVLVLLGAGCSLFSKKEIIPQAKEEEKLLDKRTGVIEVQLDASTRKIKHVLKTENEEIITLTSLGIDLNRSVGRKVQVEGMYDIGEQSMEVEYVTTLSSELSTKKEYLNTIMGLSLSYPASWFVDETRVQKEATVMIYPYSVPEIERSTIDEVIIMRRDNPSKKIPKEWLSLDEFFRSTQPDAAAYSYQESMVGKKQYAGVKAVSMTPYQVIFYVQRDTHMYEFIFNSRIASEKTLNENAFYEIITSFDFIPFNSTSIGVSQNQFPTVIENQKFDYTFYQKALSQGGLQTIAPEASKNGTWAITTYEFVITDENSAPIGVYIDYSDGTDERRLYLTYTDSKDPNSFVKQAYFIPGNNSTWTLKDGVDSGKGMKRISITSENNESIVLQAGMQLIYSRSFKGSFQIPAR